MKILRKILASALLAVATTAAADSFSYLTVTQNQGETSYAIAAINKITFSPTNMILLMNDGSKTELPLAGLSKMFFASQPTAISEVSPTAENHFTLINGTLKVNAPKGTKVYIYNIGGKLVKTADCIGDYTEIAVDALNKGVYVVRINNDSKKIMNK